MTVNPDLITDGDPYTQQQDVLFTPEVMAAAARKTVAKFATDAKDLAELLAILGLDGAGPAPCRKCGEPIARLAAAGYNQTAGDGLCHTCYDRPRSHKSSVPREVVDNPALDRPAPKAARARSAPLGLARVDTKTVRAHLKRLRDSGMTLPEIAELAGVNPKTLNNLRQNPRMNKVSADKVLAVTPRTGPRVIVCSDCGNKFESNLRFPRCRSCRYGYVPVGPARERLQQLQRAGLSRRALEELIGMGKDMITEIANPGAKRTRTEISAVTEARILAIKVPESVG